MTDIQKAHRIAFEQFKKFKNAIKDRNQSELTKCFADELLKLILKRGLLKKSISEKDNSLPRKLYRSRIIEEKDFFDEKNRDKKNLSNGLNYIEAENEAKGEFIGFDEVNSREPLFSSASGRNNYANISYLYLAWDKATACAEIYPKKGTFVSIATFQLENNIEVFDLYEIDKKIKEIFKSQESPEYQELLKLLESLIFNFNNIAENEFLKRFFQLFSEEFTKPIYNDKEYYVTQYIADQIQKYGYDGIQYRSLHTGKANLTLFHSGSSYIKYSNSEVYVVTNYELKLDNLMSGDTLVATETSSINIEQMKKQFKDYITQREQIIEEIEEEKRKGKPLYWGVIGE